MALWQSAEGKRGKGESAGLLIHFSTDNRRKSHEGAWDGEAMAVVREVTGGRFPEKRNGFLLRCKKMSRT